MPVHLHCTDVTPLPRPLTAYDITLVYRWRHCTVSNAPRDNQPHAPPATGHTHVLAYPAALPLVHAPLHCPAFSYSPVLHRAALKAIVPVPYPTCTERTNLHELNCNTSMQLNSAALQGPCKTNNLSVQFTSFQLSSWSKLPETSCMARSNCSKRIKLSFIDLNSRINKYHTGV